MKKVFSKIIAFLMAFVMLFSTISFTVGKHYCGEMLVDLSFFKEASSCGMELSKDTSRDCSVSRMNCCKDITIVVQGQEDLRNSSSLEGFNPIKIVATQPITCYLLGDFTESYIKKDTFKEYSPPLLIRDILLFDQILLI
jgi:hypothetical protein